MLQIWVRVQTRACIWLIVYHIYQLYDTNTPHLKKIEKLLDHFKNSQDDTFKQRCQPHFFFIFICLTIWVEIEIKVHRFEKPQNIKTFS